MGALKLGVQVSLDKIRAEEFCAMSIIGEEESAGAREGISRRRHAPS